MADCGNITTIPSNVHRNFDKLTEAVEKVVAQGSFPVVVGGDHAITYPVVRGLSSFEPLNIVHFDAHLDYSHDYQGELYTHAAPSVAAVNWTSSATSLRWAFAPPDASPTKTRSGTVVSS